MTKNAELNTLARKKLLELNLREFLTPDYVVLASRPRPFSPKGTDRKYSRWLWNLHIHNTKCQRYDYSKSLVLVGLGFNDSVEMIFKLSHEASKKRKTAAVYESEYKVRSNSWLNKFSYAVPSSS